MIREVDPVIFSALFGVHTCLELTEILPKSDIVEEIRDILGDVYCIVDYIIDQKSPNMKDISDFIEKCHLLCESIENMQPKNP